MHAENLINKGLALESWRGEIIADLGDVKARLFHFTPDKEMVAYEEGHDVNEWILVLSGEVLVQTPKENILLQTGDSFIVKPGLAHRLNVEIEAVGLIIRDMKKAPLHPIPDAIVNKQGK